MTIANILLVEDENDVRLLLKRVLSLEGFVVYEAENIKT
jgi:two-component system NtrC family response regulator